MATPNLTSSITARKKTRDSYDWVITLGKGNGIGRVTVDRMWHRGVPIYLEVDGVRKKVGEGKENTGGYERWYYDDGAPGSYSLIARIDDDSSALIANQDLNDYRGLPPGEGKWIVDGNEQPVTVEAGWIDPSDLEVRDCSVSESTPTVGDTVTVEATVFNTSYNPMKCDAEVFVGDARKTFAVAVDGRGGTRQQRVSASFEVTQPGPADYGVDLTSVTHNYS